jgi:photoactive yellow protein
VIGLFAFWLACSKRLKSSAAMSKNTRAPAVGAIAVTQESDMSVILPIAFDQANLIAHLDAMDEGELDSLEFGVIGFDHEGLVCRYNDFESRCAGLSKPRTIGKPLFTSVAPCMNNYMVAQRFEDALLEGTTLDATIDYVLTLKMKPVKVKLRLLATPDASHRYVVVHRA